MAHSSVRDILVLVAHPDLGHSLTTRGVIDALQAAPVSTRAELRDLYRLYPDYHVDVEAEQRALAAARLVVLVHPISWYSMPALLKLWLDDVFRLGWAYGPGGHALRGKDLWLVASTGGGAAAYAPPGDDAPTLDGCLLPYRQIARTCGMHWLPPLVLQAAHRATQAQVATHAAAFVQRLAQYPAPDDATPPLATPAAGLAEGAP